MAVPSHAPIQHRGHTTTVTIGDERFHITANAGRDGALREVFIQWSKHGSTAAGLIDGYATALSLGLRHKIPLASLLRHGLGLRFSPAGATDDPDVPRVASIADYVVRRLAIDWLPYADRVELGIYTLAERIQHAPAWPIRANDGISLPAYAATQN